MRWKLFLAGVLLGTLVFQIVPTSAEQRDAMPVPFFTQFDGSVFAASDCGPASVAMAIDYATGEHLTPLQARQALIKLPGGGYAANPDSGTAIQDLARVARAHHVEAFMGDGAASVGWGPERIRRHLAQGHTVIVLTRLAYLPGYKPTSAIDHYIILTGANASGYVYNDPGMGSGSKRTISEKQLQQAQRGSGVPGQGAAFAGPQPMIETPPAPADGSTVKVTVKPGDTLSGLAERFGIGLQELVTLNAASVKNVNHIEVGQVLNVPDGAGPAAATAAPPTPKEEPAPATERLTKSSIR
jgi:LysM repeat protein